MGKTSYKWERLIFLIFARAKLQKRDIAGLSSQKNSQQALGKGFVALALVSLWWWNWQLLVATGFAIGLMWLTYGMSPKQWRKLWERTVALVAGSNRNSNRKLVFAVVSGSLGGAIAYLMTAIWADTENHWLATGSILQGFGTLITLILLGWQINRESSYRHDTKFEQLLVDLTTSDSLKRLIAIRQLTNLVQKKALEREQRLQLIEYFYFMLAQPQEITIQEALLDSLAVLGVSAYKSDTSQSFSTVTTPIKLNVRDLV